MHDVCIAASCHYPSHPPSAAGLYNVLPITFRASPPQNQLPGHQLIQMLWTYLKCSPNQRRKSIRYVGSWSLLGGFEYGTYSDERVTWYVQYDHLTYIGINDYMCYGALLDG